MSMKQTDKHNCCFNNKNSMLITCLFRQSFDSESCRKLNKLYCIRITERNRQNDNSDIMKLWGGLAAFGCYHNRWFAAMIVTKRRKICLFPPSHFNDLSPIMGGSSKSNLRFIIMLCSGNQPLRRNLYTQYDQWSSLHAINKGFQVQRYGPKQIFIGKNEWETTIWQILIKIIK